MENQRRKAELRDFYQNLLEKVPEARRKIASENALAFLPSWIEKRLESSEFKVAAFAPFRGEIDLWPILKQWMKEGKLLLPRLSGKELIFHEVPSIETLSPSIYGILEPLKELPEVPLSSIPIILVPALAFDGDLQRLGRGLGFYDRLLPKLSDTALLVGIGFKEQLSESPLPTGPHDFPLTDRLLF